MALIEPIRSRALTTLDAKAGYALSSEAGWNQTLSDWRMMLETAPALRTPEDLALHPLLHDDGHNDWRTWLEAAGVSGVDPSRGTVFTDSSLLVPAIN